MSEFFYIRWRNQSLFLLYRKGSEPYPGRVSSVSPPYLLHIKVPLYGESTEQVRSRYGADPFQDFPQTKSEQ